MGERIESLEVVIEGDISKYKKAVKKAKEETDAFVKQTDAEMKKVKGPALTDDDDITKCKKAVKEVRQTVDAEMEKVKGPTLTDENDISKCKKVIAEVRQTADAEIKKVKGFSLADDATVESIRNMQNLIKGMVEDVKNGTVPKEISKGIDDYVKKAQLAAGIRVYTDDYQQLEKDAAKVGAQLDKLYEEESRLKAMGENDVLTNKYKKVKQSIEDTERALARLREAQVSLEKDDKAYEFTPGYQKKLDEHTDISGQLSDLRGQKSEQLKRGILHENMNTISADGRLVNVDSEIQQLEAALRKVEAEMESIENRDKMLQPTAAMQKLQKETEKTTDKLSQYKDEMNRMTAEGLDRGTAAWKRNQKAIEAAKWSQDSYLSKRAKMKAAGMETQLAAPVGMSTGSVVRAAGINAQQALAGVPKKLQEIRAGIVETVSRIPIIGRVATESAYLASKGFGGLRSVFSKVTPAIQKAGGAFASLLQKFTNGIPVLKRLGNSIRSTNRSGSQMGGIFKTIAMSAKFMFASFVIRGAIDGAKEGLQNLAQYSGTTNQSLSMLMSSLTQLKNAFATAFAPILNVVAPILNTFIQLISKAVTAIGMLFATLTGQTSFVRATEVQQDYAASLNSNASGADSANAANQKLQKTLLGFDEINKLDDNSASGSGGGGGAGAGGLSPLDMFEEVSIDTNITSFAQKLKDAWAKADFTEIGETIGNKLNSALEGIPWDKIQAASRKIAQSIATFLNGFIGATDWNLVGNTVAEGINTAIEFGYTFVTTFDWKKFGSAIAGGINGFFLNLDLSKAGQAFSEGIKGVLSVITTAAQNIDWNMLGKKIRGFFGNIDWKGIVSSMAKALGSAIGGLAGLMAGALGESVKEIKEYFFRYFKAAGWSKDQSLLSAAGSIITGLLNGIVDAIKNIGSWVKTNIFTPFIDGFKSAFGIASPSKVMKEQGGYIIDGLLQGLKENIDDIIGWFLDLPGKIKGALGDVKEWLFGKGGETIEGYKNGMDSGSSKSLLKTAGEKISAGVQSALDKLGIKLPFSADTTNSSVKKV